MKVTRILHEELKQLLEYNPETGEFFWRISGRVMQVGDRAGSVYSNGYRYIQINGLDYRAGRLAWFFVTGEDPAEFIDHKNTIRNDDRFDNLRKATNSQNQSNRGVPINSTSGIKGVSYQPSRGKWMAKITVNGRAKNLGRFATKEEAAAARRKAAIEAWGEFAQEGEA